MDDARSLLGLLDSSLNRPLPERSYAEDCTLNWSVMYDQLDIFVLAHIFGWYAKALILRDVWLCWIISVMFEVCEYSLQHQLPNFAECWWDHWVLDVLICNGIGIWAGMLTCRYFAMRTYSWRSIWTIPNVGGKMTRTIAQFGPHGWISFDWAATKSFKGYMVVIIVTALWLLCELNCFYLKYLLWIPTPHIINQVRLLSIVFSGAVALRECYQYFSDLQCKRLGTQAWVTIATILIEFLICLKYGREAFSVPAPQSVIRFWIGFITILIIFPIWQFYLRDRLPKFKSE